LTEIPSNQTDERVPHLPGEAKDDLRSILEHVRGQFQYHAGQRLNTIRYFFVTYAVFAAAYIGTFAGRGSEVPPSVRGVLSIMALAVTFGFWALDLRNQQMVHIDERGLKEIEQLVSKRYGYKHFNMTKRWEENWSLIRYRYIVPFLFFIIVAITSVAAIRDFAPTFCPK
jgi:hypothetical protein